MKRKILFALGAIAIAVVLTFNVSIAKSGNGSSVDLSLLGSAAIAQAEGPGPGVHDCVYDWNLGNCYCYHWSNAGCLAMKCNETWYFCTVAY
jgi:hypothetical protein